MAEIQEWRNRIFANHYLMLEELFNDKNKRIIRKKNNRKTEEESPTGL